jgi:McrBC 5-methylcytosine restriction system component
MGSQLVSGTSVTRRRRGKRFYGTRSVAVGAATTWVWEARDSDVLRFPAQALLRGHAPRDPSSQSARLAAQFIAQNRVMLNGLGVVAESAFDGTSVDLVVRTNTHIGAIPLLSPTTGRPDYGLVVRPRFEWSGIGPILAATGWRVLPSVLRLPLLPRSERKIPPWVLSTVILFRIRALLDNLERRFEVVSEERPAPRGAVDWTAYARRQISRAQFLRVPCKFPDLRDDRDLRGAIRFTLEKQLGGLQSQRHAGVFVVELIDLCEDLLCRVRDVMPQVPRPLTLEAWMRGPLRAEPFRDGVQAIGWTVENRGLAGLSDLEGLPWAMSMETFFEAWVETVMSIVARKVGGLLRSGRQRQTLAPLNWEPPYLGSQKYLLPDLLLEREGITIVVDAKYKQHWEEMQERRWGEIEQETRERHRSDLLQVLAYSNLARTPQVLTCLAYPCRRATWESLQTRGRLFHRASLVAGDRRVSLLLTALPLAVEVLEEAATLMAREFATPMVA